MWTSSPAQRSISRSTAPPPLDTNGVARRSLMIKSLRSVHAATVRGAPGSRVPLTNGLDRTRMSRRHPDDRPIFIRQGWPQAMSHLPWIGGQAPCCPDPCRSQWTVEAVAREVRACPKLGDGQLGRPHLGVAGPLPIAIAAGHPIRVALATSACSSASTLPTSSPTLILPRRSSRCSSRWNRSTDDPQPQWPTYRPSPRASDTTKRDATFN